MRGAEKNQWDHSVFGLGRVETVGRGALIVGRTTNHDQRVGAWLGEAAFALDLRYQIRFTPYFANKGSEVTTGNFSSIAWATSNRSKGSRW